MIEMNFAKSSKTKKLADQVKELEINYKKYRKYLNQIERRLKVIPKDFWL